MDKVEARKTYLEVLVRGERGVIDVIFLRGFLVMVLGVMVGVIWWRW